jgi:hypothetical protein
MGGILREFQLNAGTEFCIAIKPWGRHGFGLASE